METAGWRLLMEDAEEQLKSIQANYKNVTDMRALGLLQGREDVLNLWLNMAQTVEQRLEDLKVLDDNADV